MKNFDYLGVMVDFSRNSVMHLDGIKRFMKLIKKMGYNCIFPYTEDTYEVEEEPYFGYMRGRYSIEEMKIIDAYGEEIGLEVIPCIQTLAHLGSFKRWKKAPYDANDILLTDDERTYELIDRMFATTSKCFKSKKIHIGMDEANMLGLGRHLHEHGYESAGVIMKRHLERVAKIAEKYGYEPLVWSDMFFRGWNNDIYYLDEYKEMPQEYKDALPKTVTPVYWDYYHVTENPYNIMIDVHFEMSDKLWVSGAAGALGFIPNNLDSLKKMKPGISASIKKGVRNYMVTMWADFGGERSCYSLLPALYYVAQYAKGVSDEEKIKSGFKKFTGIEFDEFMLIDDVNSIAGNERNVPCNPSKYMLYSDCLLGFLDYTVKPDRQDVLEDLSKKLTEISKKSRTYGYIFKSAAALCDVLVDKYELGLKTRKAYQSGDKEELLRLANEEYARLPRLIKEFESVYRSQWMRENKTFGFEVHEHRLGGLVNRISSVRRQILAYCSGKTEKIEELEIELLPFGSKELSIRVNEPYKEMMSPNVMCTQ